MIFEDFIRQTWDIHTDHPKRVIQRVRLGLSLVRNSEELMQLALLVTHVYGEHLQRWEKGIEVLREFKNHFRYEPGTEASRAVARGIASLRVASGDERGLDAFSISDRIRVYTIAASALNLHDNKHAQRLYLAALNLATRNTLPADDPSHLSIAGTGNNLAIAMEKRTDLDDEDRSFLIIAGESSLKHWKSCGTWLEIERAEYRLSKINLILNRTERALVHAQNCLELVTKHDAPNLEKFFAFEALALATKAFGQTSEFTMARAQAGRHFNQLSDDEKAICAADWKRAV